MKKRLKRALSLCLSCVFAFSSVPVQAADFSVTTDTTGNSDEYTEYQDSTDPDFAPQASVFAQVGSLYKVTIPKVIVLSGVTKKAGYYVNVEGDLAPYETVYVVPESTVNLHTNNKAVQVGVIAQDRVTWTYSTLNTKANGQVVADGIDAGKWSGIFWFNLKLDKVLGDVIDPEHECTNFELLSSEDATCLLPSTENYRCLECRQEKTEHATPALGHNWDEGVITVEPKCTTTGIKLFTCQRCGETREEILNALGHNYVEGVCTRCGDELPLLEYTAEGYEGTYDGANHSIKVTSEGNTITYSIDNVLYDPINPEYKDVGTYTVYYKISKATYKTLTGSEQVIITKADCNDFVEPTAKTLTFDTTNQELVNSGSTSTGKILYKLNDGTYSESIPVAKNAGKYTVYYKVVGDGNHNDIPEKSITVEIKKAEGDITEPTAKELTFNGELQTLINEGSSTTGTIEYKLDDGTYSTTVPTAKDAGTYTVYYRVVSTDDNYKDVPEKSFTVTIGRDKGNLTEPTAKTIIFNGKDQELVNPGSSTTGTVMYKLGKNGTYSNKVPVATLAGSYDIYYKVVGDKNHEDVKEKVISVSIEKAEGSVVAPVGKILLHTGENLTLVTPGSSTTGTIMYKINDGQYSSDVPKASDYGVYTIYYKVVGDANHKDVTENSVTSKIADYTPPIPKTLTYNEASQNLVEPGSAIVGKIVYKLDNTSYSEAVPTATDAGRYTVYYKVVDASTGVNIVPEDSVVAIINKAESTINVAKQTNLCIETSKNISVTSNNTSGVSIINGNSSIANVTTNNKTISVKGLSAGNTEVTVNIPEDKNHKANTTKINITIEDHDMLGGQGTIITPSTCVTHGIAFHKCSKCGLDNKQVTERYSVALDPNNHEDYHDDIGYQKIPLHVSKDTDPAFPAWNGTYNSYYGGAPYLFWHYYLLNDEINIYVPETDILIAHYAGSEQHAPGEELLFSAGWYYLSGFNYGSNNGLDKIWQEYVSLPHTLANDEDTVIYYMRGGTTKTMLKGDSWILPRSYFLAGNYMDTVNSISKEERGQNPSTLPWYDIWTWHKFKYRYCYACGGGLYLENLGFVPENG